MFLCYGIVFDFVCFLFRSFHYIHKGNERYFNLMPLSFCIIDSSMKNIPPLSQSDLLTDAFGSGKQRRALQKRQKNKMAEGVVASAIGSAIDTAIATQQLHPGM